MSLCLAAILVGIAVASAQEKPAAQVSIPAGEKAPNRVPIADYSKEALVFEKTTTRVRVEQDGTGLHETTIRVRILADAGVKAMAVLQFTYTASNQQVEIGYVRVTKPDGSVVVTPDYNVQDMPADVSREAPMYSDIHQKHVAVKGLGVGDTLEYKVTQRTLKPEVPGQFWFEYSFNKDLICLTEELEVDMPADKAVTVANADGQPTITTAEGRKIYRWVSRNLARPDPEKTGIEASEAVGPDHHLRRLGSGRLLVCGAAKGAIDGHAGHPGQGGRAHEGPYFTGRQDQRDLCGRRASHALHWVVIRHRPLSTASG